MKILTIATLLILFLKAADAKTFYVDGVDGNDSNSGESAELSWKTIARVNVARLNPGDYVLFKRGHVWREVLVVPSSGGLHKPITFSAYGDGDNPVIKSSDAFRDWQRVHSDSAHKIWRGKIKGVKNHWGALASGVRVPSYFGYKTKGAQKEFTAPDDLNDMRDGFFYSPLNKDIFYFRYDVGSPGELEIGVRRYAIYIKDKSFIVIDGIDTYGPGGQSGKGSATGSAHVVVEASNHIIIKNSMHSHNHNNGIRITDGSHHCTVKNVVSNGHRSTGIYLWEAGSGNKIIDSEVYGCGSVVSDTGDMGSIGVWKTEGSVIKGCYVHDNGHEDIDGMDAAISIVRGPGTSVIQNFVKNSGGTGIFVAEYSDNSDIAYNVVQRWGVMGGRFKKNTHCGGIGVGGGPANTTIKNISIYNNFILNGGTCGENRAAIYIRKRDSSGLTINNNIIFDNGLNHDFRADNYLAYPGWSLHKNIFFNSRGSSIMLNKRVFKNNEMVSALNFFSGDEPDKKNIIMVPPKVNLLNNTLFPGSIAIDNGVLNTYTEDFNGNELPQGGGYDIGPFEYIQR